MTGTDALRTICSASLPITRRLSPRRPCVPITMRSTRAFFACRRIGSAAGPGRVSRSTVSHATPALRATSAAFARIRRPRCVRACTRSVTLAPAIKLLWTSTTCTSCSLAFCAFAKAMASRRPRPEVGLPSTGTRMRLYAIASLSSKKESPGHGPRRAHADESIACVATRHLIGERGQDPSAGCRPRMPDGDRASIHVDPIPVHGIGGGTFPAFLPCRGVCQHLGGERFVDLDQIDVLEAQPHAVKQPRHRNSWCHEEPLVRMKRGIFHGLDEGQGRPALLPRALLAHQQYGGCPVGDGRRIAGSDRSVGT